MLFKFKFYNRATLIHTKNTIKCTERVLQKSTSPSKIYSINCMFSFFLWYRRILFVSSQLYLCNRIDCLTRNIMDAIIVLTFLLFFAHFSASQCGSNKQYWFVLSPRLLTTNFSISLKSWFVSIFHFFFFKKTIVEIFPKKT